MAISQSDADLAALPGTQTGTPVAAGGAVPQEVSPEAVLELFNGATLPEVNVPSSAVAGTTIRVTGVVGFDCPLCAVDRAIRVVVEADGERRVQEVGKLSGRGETEPFAVELPAPQSPGTTVTVRIKGQRNPTDPTAGWRTDATAGPFNVNVVTQSQKTQNRLIEASPWVLGGGVAGAGIGFAVPQQLGPVAGGALGAGAGLSAFALSDEQLIPRFTFPTTEVVAGTALVGASALFLAQFSELTGFGD